MKKKFLTFGLIVFVIFFCLSCNESLKNYNNLYYLNFDEPLMINVTKKSIYGEAILLNDSVVLYKDSKLIFESFSPTWLFDSTKNKEYFNNKYIYSPEFLEIDAPYNLVKQKKSNMFQIIKMKDTLLFEFDNFEKLDFWF
jgi:hypothetical protein